MIIKSKIPILYNGFSLADYLASRFAYLDHDAWKKRVAENRFTRNEVILNEDSIVFHRDVIIYDMPDLDEPEANLDYKIIGQTEDFLVIDKPFGLMVHKHGINFRNNLIYHIRCLHEPPFPTADIVNRIDKNTSGIVLIALNKKALAKLLKIFAEREINKTYFAVVLGVPNPLCGEICAPIAKITENLKENNSNGRFCKVDSDKGKECQTEYETVKSANGHSLVKLSPKTGRTHQIRIHLAHIGTPIVGDTAYGLGEDEYKKYCEDNKIIPVETSRHLLHCSGVEFWFNRKVMYFNSPLPPEFDV